MCLGLPFPKFMGGTQRRILASSHHRVYSSTTQLTNGSCPTSSYISGFNRWGHHGNSGSLSSVSFPFRSSCASNGWLSVGLHHYGAVGGGRPQTHSYNNCPLLWKAKLTFSLVSLLDVDMWRSEDNGQASVLPSTVDYQHLGGRGKRLRL